MRARKNKLRVLDLFSRERATTAGRALRSLESQSGQTRLSHLYAMAKARFTSEAEASKWMLSPHPMLHGRSPMYAGVTRKGHQRVKDLLNCIC